MSVPLFFFFFFCLICLVQSNNNPEDLSISTHFHIACLKLNSDTRSINNSVQENSSYVYQAFSSPNLTIELCFRLCRRSIVLMNTNHTNCICLNSLNQLYDINEHLGEVLPITPCTTNALEIYSLTKDPYMLPPPTPKPMDDWSIEGCYALNNLQTKPENLSLVESNHTLALNSCREHCQKINNATQLSFYLSSKKSCYCQPMKTTPVRVPLIYCSFLMYVKDAFNNSFNESSVHADTAVKIVVERYCSSSFVFDRKLHRCSRTVLVNPSNSYKKISTTDECSPITVKTMEQYNHLVSLSSSSNSRTFVWINQDSTYLFDDLFKSKVSSLSSSGDLCLVINRTKSVTSDLVACSTARSSDYIFCAQKPMQTKENKRLDFQSKEATPILNNVECPRDFTLFDNRCYYVDKSSVNKVRAGEQVCSDKSARSTLLKFDLSKSSTVDPAEFLGRKFDDVLSELFFYQLEKTKTGSNWFGLLVGDNYDGNECVLRYFNRSTGTFATSSGCDEGGYPVCQSKPILIDENLDNSRETEDKLQSPSRNKSTTTTPHEKANENTTGNSKGASKEDSKLRLKLGLLIVVPIVSLLLITLIGGIILVFFRRRGRDSYPFRSVRSRKRLPEPKIPDETFKLPAVLCTPLKTSPASIRFNGKGTNSMNHYAPSYDDFHPLQPSMKPTKLPDRNTAEDHEENESFYDTLKPSNDK